RLVRFWKTLILFVLLAPFVIPMPSNLNPLAPAVLAQEKKAIPLPKAVGLDESQRIYLSLALAVVAEHSPEYAKVMSNPDVDVTVMRTDNLEKTLDLMLKELQNDPRN